MTDAAPRDNLRGGAWLIADMSLNIWSLSIVKAIGADYPATQIVCLRALVGLALISPLIWWGREKFRSIQDLKTQVLRVLLSVVTLSASFFAISRIPFALFTAVSFTRPLVTMIIAAALLREGISARQWIAAAMALAGVLIAVNPGASGWSWGLAALGLAVFSGSGAIIATRRLRAAPPIVMMAFYTAGLSLFSMPFAVAAWEPIAPSHLLPILLVGGFAQIAQLCFLRAHFHGNAGFLSVLGYLSLVLSVSVGYFVFAEIPSPGFAIGALLVVGAALWVTVDPRSVRTRV